MIEPILCRTLAASLLSLLAACAAGPMGAGGPPTFVPQISSGQEVRENRAAGGYALQSAQTRSVVRVQQMFGDNLEEHGALFQVVVLNLGPGALDFGPDDIKVEIAGEPGMMITRDRLSELEGKKKASASSTGNMVTAGAVASGIFASMVAGAAGGRAGLNAQQLDGAAQSISGGVQTSLEASQKLKEAQGIASDARVELFDLISVPAGKIAVGGTTGGYFVVDLKAKAETLILVNCGGDQHAFRFQPK
jgi:hypothetical protein